MRISTRRTQPIDRLRRLPLLRNATNKELGRIDRLTSEIEVSSGDVLTKEGDRPRGFVLIGSGRAIVTVTGIERGVLDAGMFFGETALLDHAPEPATVTALTTMQLRIATAREFAQLSEVPPIFRAMLKTLATRQRVALALGLTDDPRPPTTTATQPVMASSVSADGAK